ncbi:uncharacterized protein BXZ73DRAFT_37633, partial [Epithele typhae]|uniref:uncharacterized protein n=1 Tax=Epithele typhae TaxID=378194 RepID=UPI002007AFD4
PTRVFALWRMTGNYYPGVVEAFDINSSMYDIHFDDNCRGLVALRHMRAYELRSGDKVLIQEASPAEVVRPPTRDSNGNQPEAMATIRFAHSENEQEITVAALSITAKDVEFEWQDRTLLEATIVPRVRPKATSTPGRGRSSVIRDGSVPQVRANVLSRTGLIVTLSPKTSLRNWEAEKDKLMHELRAEGGIVLDDWGSIFAMEGVMENKGRRWVLKDEDIRWTNRADIDRVLLLSDDCHQKPRFLIALALGVPCVSVDWARDMMREVHPSLPDRDRGLHERQGHDKDWQPYLLPAGFSDRLEARVSQMVDLQWGNSVHYMSDITKNRVPHKVFNGMAILCISPEFVRSKGKKQNANDIKRKEAQEMVPRIILCMGAASVESVGDPKLASRKLAEYDYVVARDEPDRKKFSRSCSNCVGLAWVKDCLISGRLHSVEEASI